MQEKKAKTTKTILNKINKQPVGKPTLLNIGGIWQDYYHDEDLFLANRLAKRIQAQTEWFEKICPHKPSIGSFYESLLGSCIEETLPSTLKLATGFVYDSTSRLSSPQIDFIIYKDTEFAPLYKRDNFAIVDSNEVVSCIEVKKQLNTSILKELLRTYLNENLGTSPISYRKVQYLNIFAFKSSSIKTIITCFKNEIVNFYKDLVIDTTDGNKATIPLKHFVLPRIFFFDKSGYINTTLQLNTNNTFDLKIQLIRSSLEGHSLGEFLSYSISKKSTVQKVGHKNFLTYPISMIDYEDIIISNLAIIDYINTEKLLELYPNERKTFERISKDKKITGAYIPVGIDLSKTSLYELERSVGFLWSVINE